MSMAIRVLILEDHPEDAELLLAELRRGGLEVQWKRVDNEEDYLASLDWEPSVILADYHMPGFGANRALELLRQSGLATPFIVVSGVIGEDTAVATMRQGATDYLLKDRLARLTSAVTHALEQKRLRDEKRAMDAALREAEHRYREIVEHAEEGIFQIDSHGRMLAANPALARIMGYGSAQELMAMSEASAWRHVDPGRREEFYRELEERGAVSGFECRIYRKDSTTIWVLVSARAVHDGDGKLASFSGIVVDVTELKAAGEALRQYQEELRDLAARLIIAQETESKRLSRELHDVFGQKLAALGIELGLLRTCSSGSPSAIQGQLDRICQQISELAVNLHQTSRQLHPSVLEDLGLATAIENECAVFSEQHGIEVAFRCRTLPGRIPDDISLCLYRVLQESLRNIRKHAEASTVRVTLRGRDGTILLTIEDDGRGLSWESVRGKGGLGLISMQERVRLVGGTLSIDSSPGGGARVEARVPVP